MPGTPSAPNQWFQATGSKDGGQQSAAPVCWGYRAFPVCTSLAADAQPDSKPCLLCDGCRRSSSYMTEERCREQLFFVMVAGSDWRSWVVLHGAPYLPGPIGAGEAGDQMQRHVDPAETPAEVTRSASSTKRSSRRTSIDGSSSASKSSHSQ